MTHQGAARDAASVGYIFVGVGYYEDGHTYWMTTLMAMQSNVYDSVCEQ